MKRRTTLIICYKNNLFPIQKMFVFELKPKTTHHHTVTSSKSVAK
uniref:Uncharacterized protein n=1 Tax=Ciona intestinalis TaxID=7719 RepID=H2XYF0_CIOIN